ncbi:MAG: flagellar biosynthesis protein FliQ [Firmicutes bacterium]|jgi:flagellar biosynthetic protein FliQ|nr:flagellar biosynthesis protein FliQ [Bacillota bacterium]HOB22785.1 flagellar biosynthesis protein FliQ [Bacillota bacterium]HQD40802.1 flagellar biosynthesis protein FliQ [Bacillota bacterium]
MNEELVLNIAREALTTVLLVAGPILGLGLAVGLVVSIFQATTQIQEQTLSFIPKIVVVMLSIMIFGPWMLRVMLDFTTRLWLNVASFIG